MSIASQLDHHTIVGAMLAPALLMAATGSLLVSANARLARVVDRLRSLIVAWEQDAPDRSERDTQITRHRRRAALVLRACWMLYAALGFFIGTSLGLAADALLGFRLGAVPTVFAVIGMLCLLVASLFMGREVSLSVRSFDEELDQELARKRI
jgi:ABC-type transport system involved in cytochrome bd biosynthesis fused ATPase/permease subunit